MRWRAFIVAVLAVFAALAPEPGRAADSAVIIMYHRFGEDKYPSTNTTIAQLEDHVAELASGRYAVLPVRRIIEDIRAGRPLPDRAVGITIDDGFVSVIAEAWPRFKKAGLPFTLFTATDYHHQPIRGYMTWDQIRELARDPLVEIGHHSVSHLRMADADALVARDEIDRAMKVWEEKIARRPTLFAYPFGEAGLATIEAVRQAGFTAAFGQHSGAIGPDIANHAVERFYLPRFAFNEQWGEAKRFRQAINTVALPITEISPLDPLVARPNPPAIGFTLARQVKGIERLVCHSSHEGTGRIERLGETRIEVRYAQPLPKGRTRINCTAPAGEGRWYWFGRQFYVKG
jgi:peptidoglycan/xylan/chitin deacetylase (PgdA/CDA1 family)